MSLFTEIVISLGLVKALDGRLRHFELLII